MANRVALVEAELDRLEARQQRVREVARRRTQHPRQEEKWWQYLLELYGSDNDIFMGIRIDKRLFDEALSHVQDIRLETRGRRSAIGSHREQLLFLLIYMAKGVKSLEILVAKFIIKTRTGPQAGEAARQEVPSQPCRWSRSFWQRRAPRRPPSRADR